MKKEFKKIIFKGGGIDKFQFDFINFEDVIRKKAQNHSQFEFHQVSFYAILLFTEKEGVYNQNFKDYTFKKGTLFTLRKDSIHKFYKSKGKGIILLFTENFIVENSNASDVSKAFLLFNEMLASPKIQLNESEYSSVIKLIGTIKEERSVINDNDSPMIIRNLVKIIIAKLYRVKSKETYFSFKPKYLSAFLEFQDLVEKNCFTTKKVIFYANQMSVTTKTLNNITKSIVYKSAKLFINDILVIQIKRLIINSQASLTEIAYQVGFDEPTNFFKYFKKHVGVSPKIFRENHQRNER